MRLIRVRNPIGVGYMAEKFVAGGDEPVERFAEKLRVSLVVDPERTFIVQAWDGAELVAFVVAMAPTERAYVWVWQAWAKPGTESTAERMFAELAVWTENLGLVEIRAETTRDAGAITRRWGFVEKSVIMSYRLEPPDEGSVDNGRIVESIDHVEPEHDAGAPDARAGGADLAGVQGPAGSEDAGAAGEESVG